MIHFPIIMLFNCLIFWINICKRANHIQHSYARCSMNCKSHFTTIKLPGIDPGQGLEIPVIRMSLRPERIEVCHMYINRFSQTLSETNFTVYHWKNFVHTRERCHPHSHNFASVFLSFFFFFGFTLKILNFYSSKEAQANFCLVTAGNVDVIKDFFIIDNLFQETRG